MFRTFNMGVGIVLAIAPEDVGTVPSHLSESWVIGEVAGGDGVEWGT